MVISIIGPPNAGKTTLIEEIISVCNNVEVFSGGNVLREMAKTNPEIKKHLALGSTVFDPILIPILKQKIESNKGILILDGTTRTMAQAEALMKCIDKCVIIELTTSDEVCLKRAMERRICTSCGKQQKTNSAEKCIVCQGLLVIRDDDKIAQERLVTTRKAMTPILSYLTENNFRIIKVDDTITGKTLKDILKLQ